MEERPTVSFNIRFLKESAIGLAGIHKTSSISRDLRPIKPILIESKQVLTNTYRTLSKIVKAEKDISPASEWLLDNFYVIQEQIVQIGIDFPKAYQRNIPILAIGEHKGFPRVYEIALSMLTHTDNVVDYKVLVEYIQTYQQEQHLQLGELWAFPIMIRLFLIQILAEKASRILYYKKIKSEVEMFVTELEKEDLQEPGSFSHAISGWARVHSKKSGLLHLLELFNQLQSAGLVHEEQKRWFKYQINQYETTLEDAMRLEAQKESRLQVAIQNAIISLRQLSETDWADFVEECSVINGILKQDPAGVYPAMDFQTRDRYRKTVERLSRRSKLTEYEVSNVALNLARVEPGKGEDHSVKHHIGYFLIGDGYSELIEKVGYSMPLRERILRAFEAHFSLYLLIIFLFTFAFLAVFLLATGAISYSPAVIIAMILIAFFPAHDLAISVVNRFFAFILPPRVLPKMNYKEEIPNGSRTLVVVPTMFSSVDDALRQIENIEIHSLANPD
ncbi:MAG: glycosyltransferase 36, partial [Saprospirales bacterium]